MGRSAGRHAAERDIPSPGAVSPVIAESLPDAAPKSRREQRALALSLSPTARSRTASAGRPSTTDRWRIAGLITVAGVTTAAMAAASFLVDDPEAATSLGRGNLTAPAQAEGQAPGLGATPATEATSRDHLMRDDVRHAMSGSRHPGAAVSEPAETSVSLPPRPAPVTTSDPETVATPTQEPSAGVSTAPIESVASVAPGAVQPTAPEATAAATSTPEPTAPEPTAPEPTTTEPTSPAITSPATTDPGPTAPATTKPTTTKPATTAPATKPVPEPSASAPNGWNLRWSDEFSGSALDTSKWNAENYSTYGDGNKELACLMARPENVSLSGGVLHLTARRESAPFKCGNKDPRFPQGRDYTSAHLSTKGLASWTYGRFEVRAKLPTAQGTTQGLWPAFWLRPDDGGLGEIDVLEAVGSGPGGNEFDKVHQTIWRDYNGTPKQVAVPEVKGPTPSEDYHVYATEWEPGQMRWYVDGKLTYTRSRATTTWFDEAFSRPFYLRLNLAIGGSWPGAPSDQTQFPASYDVDYVRVYQR